MRSKPISRPPLAGEIIWAATESSGYENDEGISFGVLFVTTCKNSPASSEIYRSTIEQLVEHKSIKVISFDGVRRRSALQIKACDQFVMPNQRSIFFE